ncbi:protein LAZY 3-like [Brassica napus]|uniref:protein LAZY 3-like n=1 Tax=Brassica napus TaxID=3708 RepID=UPI00207A5764|nr:protein LAZY 3-like [Brassica napus]
MMYIYIYIAQESSGPALGKDLQSWPQDEETFLAIGTLGNNIISKEEEEEDTDSSKDLTATNTDVSIGKKKSLSFLLKKMFVCTSGFKTPPPLLDLSRDSLPNTRMEKMLRTILNKKIHPQRSNAIAKKYLENHKIIDEARSSVDAKKWVNTDSECEIFSNI